VVNLWRMFIQIRKADSKSLLFNIDVSPEFRLGIGYKHSLEKTDILEIFKVEKEYLVLEKVICDSFYPGSGDRFSPGKCTITREGNKMVAQGITEPLSHLFLRVGEFADHHLFFNGQKFRLLEYAKPGEKLEIRVIKRIALPLRWSSIWRAN
jgi:hypothetical protein